MKSKLMPIRSYVHENMYDEIKELSFLMNTTMSKTIIKCIEQGMEVMRAEEAGEQPKIVVDEIREILEKKWKVKDARTPSLLT